MQISGLVYRVGWRLKDVGRPRKIRLIKFNGVLSCKTKRCKTPRCRKCSNSHLYPTAGLRLSMPWLLALIERDACVSLTSGARLSIT